MVEAGHQKFVRQPSGISQAVFSQQSGSHKAVVIIAQPCKLKGFPVLFLMPLVQLQYLALYMFLTPEFHMTLIQTRLKSLLAFTSPKTTSQITT